MFDTILKHRFNVIGFLFDKVLDECGKSFRTLTDNDYTLASTAVST